MRRLLLRKAALLPWGVLAATGVLPCKVQAVSLYVSPVRVVLTPSRPVSSLTLGSNEETEVAVQAEVLAWSQENGQDVYKPTRDVLVNPTIFRVPPGGQQIVRLGLQVPVDATERSYRIFLQQLPRDQALTREAGSGAQLQTLLRLAVPIFVPPPEPRQEVQWRLQATAPPPPGTSRPSRYTLTLDNRGTSHLQLKQILVRRESGTELLRKSLSLYVLPGQSSADIALELPALAPETSLQIEAASDAPSALPAAIVHIPRADPAPRQ